MLLTNLLLESLEKSSAEPCVQRILWIDPSGADVVTFDVTDPNALPVWRKAKEITEEISNGQMKALDRDDFSPRGTDEQFSESRKKARDRAWAVIEEVVNQHFLELLNPKTRGPLIVVVAERHGCRRETVYDYLRRFWRGGQTRNALLPRFNLCGGPGMERPAPEGAAKRGRPRLTKSSGMNVDRETKKRIMMGIRLFYEKRSKPEVSEAYQRTLEYFFSDPKTLDDGTPARQVWSDDRIPTLDQYRYYCVKGADLAKRIVAREGEADFNRNYRGIPGESTGLAFGPGSLYQIDATVGDIYLVSSLDRSRIIGRPVIYIVIDVFSRLVAGFSVTLEGPSWVGAMLALENATIDKVAFCKEYGITITEDMWPSRHVCEVILADRGELEGYNGDNLVKCLNVRLDNTPPYRCDWKGIVERYFRLCNDRIIRWMPGAVTREQVRGGKDYRLDAVLDLHEFRILLINCILEHNNDIRMKWYRRDEFAIQDRVDPIPVELWRWGIRNRVGHLRMRDPDTMRLALLPRGEASVTPRGIEFKGMVYSSQRAITEGWLLKARHNGRWRVQVAYDPRSLSSIYLALDEEVLEPCSLTERESAFLGRDLAEAEDQFLLNREREEAARPRQVQARADLHARTEHLIKKAKQETESAVDGLSKAARTKDIRENRRLERDRERAEGAWVPPLVEEDARPNSKAAETGPADYVAPPSPIDALRSIRQKRLSQS